MQPTSGPRKAKKLSESVDCQLNRYALAAGAAAAAVLALARPADAKIVYTDVHKNIAANQKLPLDLNHDGRTDFILRDIYSASGTLIFANLSAVPAAGNGVDGIHPLAYALKRGAVVGPRKPFASKDVMGIRIEDSVTYPVTSPGYGSWSFSKGHRGVSNRYLGFRFKIAGKVHYGWARLSTAVGQHKRGEITATLTGYAYETIPNKPIITGKTKGPYDSDAEAGNASLIAPRLPPATLGMLTLGAPALSIWRRQP
jgi:hypothetical protein